MSSSGSVTPQRRPRDESEESELDDTNYEDAPTSQARKRQRFSNDNDDSRSEDDESEEDVVLPDSYRRSPKGKGRARDGPANASQTLQHRPGSIVRITMKTFVTYSHAEFFPGPGLNMIIGPNGTGKSTVVCGICLGLGWSAGNLGRAKEIVEFIKHGSKDATIEIELKADPERQSKNPVIKSVISKDGGKSDQTFFLNGKKSTKKAVQEVVRSFSIQVDNLCQFLPQDRVVEFAGLSPVELLVQTQKAAAPEYMSEWHEQLKSMRKEEKKKQDSNQNLIEDLKGLERKQREQADQVARMRDHSEQQKKVASLEKIKPFAKYELIKRLHTEAKERRRAAEREYGELQNRAAPNLQAMNDKRDYFSRMEKVAVQKKRLIDSTEKLVSDRADAYRKADEAVQSCEKEVSAENESGKTNKQNISRHQVDIRKIEQQLANPPPPFDPAEFNDRAQDLTRAINEKSREADGTSDQLKDFQVQGKQRQEMIAREQQKRTHLQSQAGRLGSKLDGESKDTARVWQWVQDNRDKFTSPVYGPPMIECHVSDPKHAGWLETALGKSELLAITVTSSRDFQMLTNQYMRVMELHDVNVRRATQRLETYKAPISKAELTQLGLEGWLMELIEGPDDILAMLCENRNLHMTAYTSGQTEGDVFKALERSSIGSWVTPTKSYQVVRRREYGDAGIITRVQDLKKPRLLTDAPVDTQAEQESGRRISELQDEIDQIKAEIAGVKTHDSKLKADIKRLEDEREAVKAEKNQKQRQQTNFEGLQTKLDGIRVKLDSARTQHAERGARLNAIFENAESLALKKGQIAIDYAKAISTLQGLYKDLLDSEIMRIEAQSDHDQLKEQNEEETRLLEVRRNELQHLQQVAQQLGLDKHRLHGEIRELADTFNDYEKEVYQGVSHVEPDELQTEIERARAQLDMLGMNLGNANTIAQFEERAVRINEKRAQVERLETDLDALTDEINNIRGRWEPQLDELVRQISEAFAENFSRIQCAGEVAVHKDDDFDQWAIEIKVKFREDAPLNILNAQRQSGGERAVSTIFYLMSLQSLARAPFRVVDEINQGMDPRNERLVHSRMVDIACEEHTSQYFLITPKLLNGLKYHPHMKVHCIASGEYMPGKDAQLGTFEALAKKALAIRASAA